MTVKEKVYDTLNRAVVNGYVELREMTASELGYDLMMYPEEFEEFTEVTLEEIVPFCQMWLDGVP